MSPNPISPVSAFAGAAATGAHPSIGIGSHLEGTVTALDRDGHPLVRTAQGVLTLPASLPLKVGMRVLLEFVQLGEGMGVKLLASSTPDSAALRPGPPIVPAPGALATNAPLPKPGFTGLEAALAELDTATPSAAEQTRRLLPGGDGVFMTTLFNAVNAMRRGDLAALIGEGPLRAIERNRDQSGIDRLRSELSAQPKLVSIDSGSPWQALFVPVYDGDQLRRIGFFARRPEDEAADGDGHQPVRFLVEVEPSAIGPLQLDGFFLERRLDLIVRSERPIEPEWRDEIRALYGATIAALDLAGELTFQVVAGFPLSGAEALAGEIPGLDA